MKKGKVRQVFAILGIVILLGLYVATLITAIMAKPYAHQMFIVSVFCSFVIPVILYGFILMGKAFGRKEKNGMSLGEFRRMKKKMSKMPEEELESEDQAQADIVEKKTKNK
ncbi:MAG: hypothetical protein PUC65_01260 [Clostridiales bacterium]|nr:hypothetical protein [Clostridiales bacterium]